MDLASVRVFAPRTRIEGVSFKQFLIQKGYFQAEFSQDKRSVLLSHEIPAEVAQKLQGRSLYDFSGILRVAGFRAYQIDVYELAGDRLIVISHSGTRLEGMEVDEFSRRQGSDEGTGNYRINGGTDGSGFKKTSVYNP